MDALDLQLEYWNGTGAAKTFSHPVPVAELLEQHGPEAAVLDYGCGYGRVCAELTRAGFRNVLGVDASAALVARGKAQSPDLDLRAVTAPPLPLPPASFDICLLVALLTCVPTDAGAAALLAEAHRLLRPGGVLFLSDYPLQKDARNLARYKQFEPEFGSYGVFRTEGAVFRHFALEDVGRLLAGFDVLWRRGLKVLTLNGHEADIIQVLARKRTEPQGA
ncbi:class I SAM-dependent methyltransferase [Humidesulfovibrio idahonensis]